MAFQAVDSGLISFCDYSFEFKRPLGYFVFSAFGALDGMLSNSV